mgnify:CR=1 FL=1
MKTVYHEAMHPLGNLGLKISMAALESPHIPMHWHDAMEILFCLNGEVTIQIDHEAFLLSRNQLVVFDSKEMHSIQSASPLYMFLCIHVDKKQMALYCPDLELYHIQCQPLPLDHPKSTEYLTLCQLARDLTRSSIKKESTSTMRSDGIALLMLSDLIQSFSVYAPLGTATGEKKPNDALRVIISYVTEHYPEKITLNDISARIGFSKEYFCRFFKRSIGKTPIDYINDYRLNKVIRLLETGDAQITEICLECGFNNMGNFQRLFKRKTGITPLQYRKLYLSKKSE